MSVELVEEIHQQVDLQRADAQHHVFLRLRPVAAVVAAQLLALHPQWEYHQRHADEDDHQQLGGPDLWRDVAVAHGGEALLERQQTVRFTNGGASQR
ncbi:hypothetical protein EYF80_039106 [Liparis tanakae]|uniref:Uncharacterized protein n=1 Tax=Liparis tanakae TaxID=230148 RepID=A0A4Z2GAT9_9TELE|nr:hypothetical protein EYF80_039106 [Liparis tanakae]